MRLVIFSLMPSRFEPCGLVSDDVHVMALPLVHEVGGLRDTVEPTTFIVTGNRLSFNNSLVNG